MRKVTTTIVVLIFALFTVASAQTVSTPDGFDAAKLQLNASLDMNVADVQQVVFQTAVPASFTINLDDVMSDTEFDIYIPLSNGTNRDIEVTTSINFFSTGGGHPWISLSTPAVESIAANGTGDIVVTVSFGTIPSEVWGTSQTFNFTANLTATADPYDTPAYHGSTQYP